MDMCQYKENCFYSNIMNILGYAPLHGQHMNIIGAPNVGSILGYISLRMGNI